MHAMKNALRVRVLKDLQLEIPINKGFEAYWWDEILPIKWLEVSDDAPVSFGAKGVVLTGGERTGAGAELYRYRLAQEMPRIFEQNQKQKQHPVLKALNAQNEKLVDLTLGEGRDSLTFLKAGRQVISYERHPFIAFYFLMNLYYLNEVCPLPLDQLEIVIGQFKDDPVAERNAQFYYDPMYRPEKRKSLPRGTIQLFENLVQAGDEDQAEYLQWLIENCGGKIVVKRAKTAKPIIGQVNYGLETKLVRYDVYLGRHLR